MKNATVQNWCTHRSFSLTLASLPASYHTCFVHNPVARASEFEGNIQPRCNTTITTTWLTLCIFDGCTIHPTVHLNSIVTLFIHPTRSSVDLLCCAIEGLPTHTIPTWRSRATMNIPTIHLHSWPLSPKSELATKSGFINYSPRKNSDFAQRLYRKPHSYCK